MKRRKRAARQRKKLRNSTRSATDQQLMRGRRRTAALDACLPQKTSAGQRLCTDSCSVWFSKSWRREKWSSGKCVSSNVDQKCFKSVWFIPWDAETQRSPKKPRCSHSALNCTLVQTLVSPTVLTVAVIHCPAEQRTPLANKPHCAYHHLIWYTPPTPPPPSTSRHRRIHQGLLTFTSTLWWLCIATERWMGFNTVGCCYPKGNIYPPPPPFVYAPCHVTSTVPSCTVPTITLQNDTMWLQAVCTTKAKLNWELFSCSCKVICYFPTNFRLKS